MKTSKFNNLTAKERLAIICKQWATTKDISMLASVGISNATIIREEIKQYIENKNNNLFCPKYLIPMKELIKYLNIDVKYLIKQARIENKLFMENTDNDMQNKTRKSIILSEIE